MRARLPDGDQGFDTLMITSQPCPHSHLQPPVTRTELTEPYLIFSQRHLRVLLADSACLVDH